MRKLLSITAVIIMFIACVPQTGPRAQGEILYNGIVLPGEWPPRYPLPDKREAMPVPYLENKPAVIPVNVGRQLFVDDFLIDSTDLVRSCHQADMYPGNPVLQGDLPWETNNGTPYADPFSGGVWYDELQGLFKMWYRTGEANLTSYAESTDGIHWTKPMLDVKPGTNAVLDEPHDNQSVWLDKQEKDLSRRYKMVDVNTARDCFFYLRYSPDGIHWSDTVATSSGRIQDRSTVSYNPFRKKWVASLRITAMRSLRARGYIEDDSLERVVRKAHWVQDEIDSLRDSGWNGYILKDSTIAFWFGADDQDYGHPFPDIAENYQPAIYNFDATAYESIMLGEYSVWRGPENHECERRKIPKLNEFCIGFSRDGFHYSRPSHKPVMESDQREGVWNWGNMQPAIGNPIIVGDSLYFYCGGHKRNDIFWDGWISTGLARMRRDGFVSMDAGDEGGTLVTSPVSFDGRFFFVNAAAKSLKVEVLDAKGRPIKRFSGDNSITLEDIDSTKQRVVWKDEDKLESLIGKAVRFKFTLRGGSLYSFWLSPWETGESRGYTGGGGPGLNPSGIDEPLQTANNTKLK